MILDQVISDARWIVQGFRTIRSFVKEASLRFSWPPTIPPDLLDASDGSGSGFRGGLSGRGPRSRSLCALFRSISVRAYEHRCQPVSIQTTGRCAMCNARERTIRSTSRNRVSTLRICASQLAPGTSADPRHVACSTPRPGQVHVYGRQERAAKDSAAGSQG